MNLTARTRTVGDDTASTPLTIGYVEYVDLPDWGITRLRAKIDTGARTSALHVTDIEELPEHRLRFKVVRDRKRDYRQVECEAPIARITRVRSSNGVVQTRYVVLTTLQIGHVSKQIEVSLATRGPMIHRMLLGRRSLENDFLIDAGRKFAASEKTRKKKRKAGKKSGTTSVKSKNISKKRSSIG